MADLEENIQFLQQHIEHVAQDDPDRPQWLTFLGIKLHDRYELMRASADLEAAIVVWQQAVDIAHPQNPDQNQTDRALMLYYLGVGLADRYSLTGKLEDLEESIRMKREALDLTPRHELSLCVQRLNDLSCGLVERYAHTGNIQDLEEAIQTLREAVEGTPSSEHINRALRLSNLGAAFSSRYQRTGSLADLEEAVKASQQAVDTTHLYDCLDRAIWLNNLGLRLGERYQRVGAISDFETAIQMIRSAVAMTPDGHPDLPIWLNNLGTKLVDRYNRTEALADLEEAIQMARKVVDARSEYHRDAPTWLNNLAVRLYSRYRRKGMLHDLTEAIQIQRESVNLALQRHSEPMKKLNNLGVMFTDRYNHTGNPVDLEEGIQILRHAMDLSSNNCAIYAVVLDSLGYALNDQYSRTKDPADLEESIQVGRKSVNVTPQDHPQRAGRLNNLAYRLARRYQRTRDMADIREASSEYESALRCANSPAIYRIMSATALLQNHALSSNWKGAYEAGRCAISLVPKVTQRSLEAADMQHRLGEISGLACDAASMALEIQSSPLEALNFLESGRGVLATSLEDKRADVSSLQQSFPELATQFIDMCRQMESPVLQNKLVLDLASQAHPQDHLAQRSKIDRMLDELIEQIRMKPGFDNFLLPPSKQEMCDAAKGGPIVVVNVSSFRCDGIIITPFEIRSIALSDLRSKDIDERAQKKHFGTPNTLKWLWDVIAKPILDFLNISYAPYDNNWPRIWWVPTGSLSKFPLHAAGYHDRDSFDSVIDRVMSSYSPTVKAIVQSQKLRAQRSVLLNKGQALLIAMEDTPGQHVRLDFAKVEIETVQNLCESMGLNPIKSGCGKNDVTIHLPQCQIFHFAGHSSTNLRNPSQGYLALEDWVTDPLTVADLLNLNLRAHAPFLAYLSACGTGQVKHEKSLDESVHMMSACQLAGFQHVIGTLWEVNDEVCVDIARTTYETIRDDGMKDTSVCLGLHRATRELRQRWFETSLASKYESNVARNIGRRPIHETNSKINVDPCSNNPVEQSQETRDIITVDDDDDDDNDDNDDNNDREAELWQWVPYVHFGL